MKNTWMITLVFGLIAVAIPLAVSYAQEGEEEPTITVPIDKSQITQKEVENRIKRNPRKIYNWITTPGNLSAEQKTEWYQMLFPDYAEQRISERNAKLDDLARQMIKLKPEAKTEVEALRDSIKD
jgi:hypothetical protein